MAVNVTDLPTAIVAVDLSKLILSTAIVAWVHLAYTVVDCVNVVEEVIVLPVQLLFKYQPPKVYLSLVGADGIVTVLSEFNLTVW